MAPTVEAEVVAPEVEFAERLKRARAARGLTARELAFKVGTGQSQVLKLEEAETPDNAEPGDLAIAKAANPAPWITRADIGEQRLRVAPIEWEQFHLNRWNVSSARWLPRGAWQAARADYQPSGAPMVLGIDIGGARAASAIVGVVADEGRVSVELVEIRQGRGAVLEVAARVAELAREHRVAYVVADPMRYESEMQRHERDDGIDCIEWPQAQARMTRCSEHLHGVIVEGRLRHPGHPELDRHVASAIAVPTPRGWRLSKDGEAAQIDGVISLAMAVEVACQHQPAAKFIGMAA